MVFRPSLMLCRPPDKLLLMPCSEGTPVPGTAVVPCPAGLEPATTGLARKGRPTGEYQAGMGVVGMRLKRLIQERSRPNAMAQGRYWSNWTVTCSGFAYFSRLAR